MDDECGLFRGAAVGPHLGGFFTGSYGLKGIEESLVRAAWADGYMQGAGAFGAAAFVSGLLTIAVNTAIDAATFPVNRQPGLTFGLRGPCAGRGLAVMVTFQVENVVWAGHRLHSSAKPDDGIERCYRPPPPVTPVTPVPQSPRTHRFLRWLCE